MKKKNLAATRGARRPYKPKERKKRFLLYCEGVETEPSYFVGLRDHLRSQLIEVEIGDDQGDPKRLVEMAKRRRDTAKRAAAKQEDENLLYDEVWCIFDVDEHVRLRDAIKQAKDCSIDVAVSNPSFELWVLIHFRDQWAFITRQEAFSKVSEEIHGYHKHIDFAILRGRASKAVQRASTMEQRATENSHQYDNPTTAVWHLVRRLCAEARVDIADL